VSAEIRGIADYSPHWLKFAELQSRPTARTRGSSPAEIDSELVSHRLLDTYLWWLVTDTRSCLQDFCRQLTQSLSYLQPTVALLYTDFDVLGFHRIASAQKQTTTDINNCRTSTS